MPKIIKYWLFSALISLTVMLMYKGITAYYDNKYSDSENPVEVNAITLATAYLDNEVLADSTYKNDIIIVTGEVLSVGESSTVFTINLYGGIYTIDCSFTDPLEMAKVASIVQGDEISVQGKCLGLNIVYVTVYNCSLID